MANRFWVGGTGTWDLASTTHWSATTGGASGASTPTSADSVFFDANSFTAPGQIVGASTVNLPVCLDMNWTGALNSPTLDLSSSTLTVSGSAVFIANMSINVTFGGITFNSTSTGKTITTNGLTLPKVTFSGSGGGWTLQDNYTGAVTTLNLGSLDTNSKNITVTGFNSSGTNVRTLTLGNSLITITGSTGWALSTTTNLTFNAGTSTINMNGASQNFQGGGLAYNNVNATGNNLTVSGNNTISTFTPTAGNAVNWTSGSNQTITNPFGANGTAGNLINYQSTTAGSPFTFTKSSGTATADYYSIKDSTATGAGILYATVNSVDAGGNTGWHFISNALGASSVTASSTAISDSKVNSVMQGSSSVTATASTTAYSTKRFKQTLADAKATIFYFGGKTYILDGTNYLRYDGTSLIDVSTVAYVPTLTLGRAPTGGGTANENFNLLGAGFQDSFTAPAGTPAAYQLSLTGLDATAVTATVNGVAKVETTDFTVNRSTGVVTFTVGPAVGTANNVVIQAYKTPTGYANRVKQCIGASIYGGTNDTRVFFFGNPNFPSTLRRTALNDPTYLPEFAYNLVGTDQTLIKGMSKHYNDAIIFKEASPNNTAVFLMSYAIDSAGVVTFPTLPLNAMGCLASGSITTIEDTPIFIGTNGINRIVGTNVSSQRDVRRISDRVNLLLLAESTLTNAVAISFDQKYILTLNNNAYVYDFRQDAWYLWDNIPANCFAELDSFLYFGSRTNGNLYKFKKATDTLPYNDDGSVINSYWKSKVIAFDDEAHLKNVPKVMVMLKPNSRSSADLSFVTDRTNEQFVATGRADLFDYSVWDYSNFAYAVSAFPQPIVGKIKAKKLIYIQFILRNPRIDDSLGILSLSIQHQQGRLLK